MNQNVGKKASIPLSTSGAQALPPSSVDKITAQAQESAKSASFAPAPSMVPVAFRRPLSGKRPGRKPSNAVKNIMKGIYFEPVVHKALTEMQAGGQNVSKYINQLVRQALQI